MADNEVTGQAPTPPVPPTAPMDEQQLSTLATDPNATGREIRAAKRQCESLISDVLEDISALEIEKRAAADQNDRTSIDSEMRGHDAHLVQLQSLKAALNKRLDGLNNQSAASTRGARLHSRSRESASFLKELSSLPKKIERKALKARRKTDRDLYQGLLASLLELKSDPTPEGCSAFLQRADQVAFAKIEASGSLHDELLDAFRSAVMAFAPTSAKVTPETADSSTTAE